MIDSAMVTMISVVSANYWYKPLIKVECSTSWVHNQLQSILLYDWTDWFLTSRWWCWFRLFFFTALFFFFLFIFFLEKKTYLSYITAKSNPNNERSLNKNWSFRLQQHQKTKEKKDSDREGEDVSLFSDLTFRSAVLEKVLFHLGFEQRSFSGFLFQEY